MAHVSREELQRKLDEAARLVQVGGVYYHWRDKHKFYRVAGLTIAEWSDEVLVQYTEVGMPKPLPFSRLLQGEDGWLTTVTDSLGQEQARFVQVHLVE